MTTAAPMPTIIFDHIKNVVFQVGADPKSDKKLAELLDAQRRSSLATSSGIPKRD